MKSSTSAYKVILKKRGELQNVFAQRVYWLESLNIPSWSHSITQRNLFIHGSNWINSRCCIWCCSYLFLWDPELNTLFWLLTCPCSHGLMRDGISKALIEMVCKHPWMWQPFSWPRKSPACNLAPGASPLWGRSSYKSGLALVIRKQSWMLLHTDKHWWLTKREKKRKSFHSKFSSSLSCFHLKALWRKMVCLCECEINLKIWHFMTLQSRICNISLRAYCFWLKKSANSFFCVKTGVLTSNKSTTSCNQGAAAHLKWMLWDFKVGSRLFQENRPPLDVLAHLNGHRGTVNLSSLNGYRNLTSRLSDEWLWMVG